MTSKNSHEPQKRESNRHDEVVLPSGKECVSLSEIPASMFISDEVKNAFLNPELSAPKELDDAQLYNDLVNGSISWEDYLKNV